MWRDFLQNLVKLLGLAPKPIAPPVDQPQDALAAFISPSGRLRFERLRKFALTHKERDFIQLVRRPVLFGTALLKGELISSLNNMTKTTYFMAAKEEQDPEVENESENMENAIYPLMKTKHKQGARQLFTIGRTDDNDLVMPDYTLSKNHAEIVVSDKGYVLKDLGSTNGTSVNGHPLAKQEDILLQDGTYIKLGRYEFVFLTPKSLYAKLTGKKVRNNTVEEAVNNLQGQETGESIAMLDQEASPPANIRKRAPRPAPAAPPPIDPTNDLLAGVDFQIVETDANAIDKL